MTYPRTPRGGAFDGREDAGKPGVECAGLVTRRTDLATRHESAAIPGRQGEAARSVAILLHAGGRTAKCAKSYIRSGSIDITELGKDR